MNFVQNIAKMKEQLNDLGCVFDWDREIGEFYQTNIK